MIPFVEWHTIQLGPVTLQVWGLFVGLGFLLGTFFATKLAKERGEDPKIITDLVPWLVLGAIVGGRLGDALFYRPGFYLADPTAIFKVWEGGASMFGGLIFCAIIAVIYFKKKQVDVWKYADLIGFGLPFGITLGRIGCFLIHDHPGTLTDFFLGVKYPDGVRHDLGLYESLDMFVLSILFLWLSRKPRSTGFYLSLFAISYGTTRFFLDFLRVNDVTLFGLTPAQYLCLLLVTFGLSLGYHHQFKVRDRASSYDVDKEEA
jgi:phosphatidylglycerol:prolipoprotein diacylglycerol transferase